MLQKLDVLFSKIPFNGSKRLIAYIYWVIWLPVTLIPDIGVPRKYMIWSAIFGIVLNSIGAGHGIVKDMKVKQGAE